MQKTRTKLTFSFSSGSILVAYVGIAISIDRKKAFRTANKKIAFQRARGEVVVSLEQKSAEPSSISGKDDDAYC
jgi:hypothetical protein